MKRYHLYVQFLVIGLLSLLVACGGTQSQATESSKQDAVTEQHEPSEEAKEESGLQKKEQGTYADPIIKDEDVSVSPKRLQIPAIDVDATIEKVGLLDNGQMGVPEKVENVGWYEPGAKPGARGSSVIAGHADSKTGPAVFYDLQKLKKGDEIVVTSESGESLTFIVTGRDVFPQYEAPVEKIFGYTARRSLKLITCTGEFIRSKGGHQDRLVVYTELKES
ncbi:class F sortase [Halobacillus yeomjeoni]|uniref:Class F sortase n=1 Tax=Halobacillus yeomjeoni TaxID=311194 RepID=A0A931MVP6_9BACI|nr:class F sortase [Halobacillus yeomjeoni]MBH0230850.1 class F sortase [Halobacillus yeomjeoni]